jgi:hypothetical protein
MKVLVNATTTGLWHDIIHEAEAACRASLPSELESYLVFLLMRYMDKPEVAKQVLATFFMESLKLSANQRQSALQQVGDTCLLFSGLFPGIAEKRLVKISYFVNLGRSAYATISLVNNDIYALLTRQFVPMMDVLNSLSQQHLLPLQAYELWNELGSQRALNMLNEYSQGGIPHNTPQLDDDENLIRIKK